MSSLIHLTDRQMLEALYRRFIDTPPPGPTPFSDGATQPMNPGVARKLLPLMEVPNDKPVSYVVKNSQPPLPTQIAPRNILAAEAAGFLGKGTAVANADDNTVVLPGNLRAYLAQMVNNWDSLVINFYGGLSFDLPAYIDELVHAYGEQFTRALEVYWDQIALGETSPFARALHPPVGYVAPNGMPLAELLKKGNAA